MDRPVQTKDEVKATIRALWSEVLESDQLRGDVDFYDAGGSSLKSLILLSDLNQAFETEFEIAELVDCRTIDRQSEAIWSRITRGTTARGEQTVLVPLARASQTTEADARFVALHDVSGDIYGYTSLAGELSGRVDLHGIKLSPERFDGPRALSIPELAAEYVEALESAIDDSRPLVLLGWSLGGMVGFEMAKLLDRRRRPVARLVLIDSPYQLDLPSPDDGRGGAFSPERERALLDEYGWLGGGAPLFPDDASIEEMWRAVRGLLDGPARERLVAELRLRFPLMGRAIPHLASLDPLELVRHVNRFRSVFHAGRGYLPTETTTAPIELFTASRSQNFDPRWSGHTSATFQRGSLDGDHFSILDRRSIRDTARAILPSNDQ